MTKKFWSQVVSLYSNFLISTVLDVTVFSFGKKRRIFVVLMVYTSTYGVMEPRYHINEHIYKFQSGNLNITSSCGEVFYSMII